ncbi:MAG: transporter [Burkholderiaceae bacterium]|nr:transporter [Burkholderiaceae bacterium]
MARQISAIILAAAAALLAGNAQATEGGGGVYPNGNENYLVGAMPPPGTYWLAYSGYDQLTKLRDNNGDRINVPFDVKVGAFAPRFVWVTDTKILGGQLAWHVIVPLLNVDVSVAGSSQTKTGLGDIVFGPGLGYHEGNLHYVFALDVNAPTGSYKKTDLANTSRNYWNLEPLIAVSYVQPQGINADIKFHYDFNAENNDTKYKSGQEFHFDYALGYGFGNGWVAGVGGYVYQQVTADKLNGATVANAKGEAMGFGPSIKYDNGKGFFITAKWQKDFSVKNRAEGTALKVKFSIPF